MTTLHFLPGTMCDRRVWEPVWAQLPSELQPAYIPTETERTRAGMLELIASAAAAGPIHLVGFSMGGYMALDFTLSHPDKVASLITVCTSAFGLDAGTLAERQRTIRYLETRDYHGISQPTLDRFIHPTRSHDPAVAGVMRAMDADLGKETLLAQMRETSRRADLSLRLREIACPQMFVGADSDPYLTIDQQRAMSALAPAAMIATAREAGHMLPLEQPAWLARAIRSRHVATGMLQDGGPRRRDGG